MSSNTMEIPTYKNDTRKAAKVTCIIKTLEFMVCLFKRKQGMVDGLYKIYPIGEFYGFGNFLTFSHSMNSVFPPRPSASPVVDEGFDWSLRRLVVLFESLIEAPPTLDNWPRFSESLIERMEQLTPSQLRSLDCLEPKALFTPSNCASNVFSCAKRYNCIVPDDSLQPQYLTEVAKSVLVKLKTAHRDDLLEEVKSIDKRLRRLQGLPEEREIIDIGSDDEDEGEEEIVVKKEKVEEPDVENNEILVNQNMEEDEETLDEDVMKEDLKEKKEGMNTNERLENEEEVEEGASIVTEELSSSIEDSSPVKTEGAIDESETETESEEDGSVSKEDVKNKREKRTRRSSRLRK